MGLSNSCWQVCVPGQAHRLSGDPHHQWGETFQLTGLLQGRVILLGRGGLERDWRWTGSVSGSCCPCSDYDTPALLWTCSGQDRVPARGGGWRDRGGERRCKRSAQEPKPGFGLWSWFPTGPPLGLSCRGDAPGGRAGAGRANSGSRLPSSLLVTWDAGREGTARGKAPDSCDFTNKDQDGPGAVVGATARSQAGGTGDTPLPLPLHLLLVLAPGRAGRSKVVGQEEGGRQGPLPCPCRSRLLSSSS